MNNSLSIFFSYFIISETEIEDNFKCSVLKARDWSSDGLFLHFNKTKITSTFVEMYNSSLVNLRLYFFV